MLFRSLASTSLVEASVLGRHSIGTDLSELAIFVGRVKTTSLSDHDLENITQWADALIVKLNMHRTTRRPKKWIANGYQRNINSLETWRIRKLLELAISRLTELTTRAQQDFARCVLLNCGQWALDCRTTIPTTEEFRRKLRSIFTEMIAGAREYTRAAKNVKALCLHRSVIGVELDPVVAKQNPPRLILLSPPYPGVYVLYHRWKVQGRKETPAPFWVANSLDGSGMAYYTLGDRKQQKLRRYFEEIKQAFTSVAKVANEESWLVQMVGFSNPSWQLPMYLQALSEAGFTEVKLTDLANARDGRLWRSVPNRKWFAAYQDTAQSTAREVVLFHRRSL